MCQGICMRKSVTLLLILVFLVAPSITTPLPVKAESKTIVVPDDYPTIQAAVGNASAGDTVFVKKGTYDVYSIGIAKPINLVGEDRDQTVINGGRDQNKDKVYPIPWDLAALEIYASNTAISGFTLTNCFVAISVGFHLSLSSVEVTGNNFVGNNKGIDFSRGKYLDAENFIISDNNFANNTEALDFDGTESEISRNAISGNIYGVFMYEAKNVTVKGNRLVNNSFSLTLQGTSNIEVSKNIIAKSTRFSGSVVNQYSCGIEFRYCNDSFVHDNSIEENSVGIYFPNINATGLVVSQGSGNLVYHNNFIDNARNVNVTYQHRYNVASISNGADIVSWDYHGIGNYWSDYDGQGNYVIDENNIDNFPLTQPVDISGTSTIIAVIAIATAVVAVFTGLIFYFRKR
jgi:parallel beta-helix repeat protein